MRKCKFIFLVLLASFAFLSSCNTFEKASSHGFLNGYYKVDSDKNIKHAYIDISEEKIDIYSHTKKIIEKEIFMSIPLKNADSIEINPIKFQKKSLDIDITTILLKYRPSVYNLPDQLTADLNISLYAGWRHDSYKISTKTDPLGKRHLKYSNFGFDFGIFAGPGATTINSFTTNNRTNNEYSGMIIQTGIAGFLESNIASFGFAVGIDNLLNRDSDIWIYNNKPWLGFILGIALN